MDWVSLFGVAKDAATGLAAIGAVWIGALGLRTWSAQLKGKTEYDLARRILRAVYEVRVRIGYVRNPFMSAGEIATAFEAAGIEDTGDGAHERASELVYAQRWNKLADAMSDLEVESLEAEVLWGPDVRQTISGLKRRAAELYVAIQRELRWKSGTGLGRVDPDGVEKNDRILYMTSIDPEQDEFAADVNRAVAEAEAVLRPHLKL